jgi:hypothetical protein
MPVFSSLIEGLFLTVLVELIVAFLLGSRQKDALCAVLFINLLTNPILNYVLLVGRFLSPWAAGPALISVLETGVVFIEWRLLVYALPGKSIRFLALSLVMNLFSYLAGLFFLN